MPVDITSRYRGTPIFEVDDARRGRRPTVAIRPSTPPPADGALFRHVVTGVEDLEYLAWRYYGSSEAWWRIAEANRLMFPFDLRPGMALSIPAAEDLGLVERIRVF